ncbi:MAG: hypothetical protein ACI8P0_004458, partial [Planctomycetaceae bacterium]
MSEPFAVPEISSAVSGLPSADFRQRTSVSGLPSADFRQR